MDKPDSSDVLCGIASLVVPGAGQLVQGRIKAAALMFFGTLLAWLFLLGWLVHLYAGYEAATHHPRRARSERLETDRRRRMIDRIRSTGSARRSHDRG